MNLSYIYQEVFIAIILDLTRREANQEKLKDKTAEIEQTKIELEHQKHAMDEHAIVSPTDLSRVDVAFFTLNGLVSLVLGAATVVDAFV